MLQRAASNAYSWWWASHIRTKQSKWLDSDLQEMEERVNHMLELLGEEADSFSKRAEMYYKRRPEVISSVEEAYRAYRALAERYDHISGELHKANHTIAVAFPEQVQYAMLEEEDDNFPKAIMPIHSSKVDKRTVESLMKRKGESSSSVEKAQQHRTSAPQLSKESAQEEINRLQKAILVLQTEKEFVKSSYESGIAKYWDIEKQIIDMQEEVCYYQDEFNASAVIEDDEARALMTATALKSCEDAIISFQEQQKKSIMLARMESARISSSREKLKALKGECGQSMEFADISDGITGTDSIIADMKEEDYSLKHEKFEMQLICEKVKEHLEMNSDSSVEELAEKIDKLVNKVINLELTVSSQTAQINNLSLENSKLEECLQNLEEEKMFLINDSDDVNDRLKQAEEELSRAQTLAKTVQDEENTLFSNFTEVFNNLSDIAENLQSSDHEGQVIFVEEEAATCNLGPPTDCDQSILAKVYDTEEKLVEEGIYQIQEPVPISSGCIQSNTGSQIAGDLEKAHEFSIQKDKLKDRDSSQTGQYTLYVGLDSNEELKGGEKFKEINPPQDADSLPPSGSGNIQDSKEGDEFTEKDLPQASDHITLCGSENILDLKHGENCVQKESLAREHISPISEEEKSLGDQEVILNLQQLLLNGLEGREKLLLTEYTSILRNYKKTKKRLIEVEQKNQERLHETEELIKELRNANAIKDDEIRSLRQIFSTSTFSADITSGEIEASKNGQCKTQSITFLPVLITESSEPCSSGNSKDPNSASPRKADTSNDLASREKPHAEDSKLHFFDETLNASPIEQKFRSDIDTLLDENLEFWLRFSTSFNQVQEFKAKYQELRTEIEKLKDEKTQELSNRASTDLLLKHDSEPVERRLRALKTQICIWLEQNALFRGELQSRFSSLCSIQDGITEALRKSSDNGTKFTSHQAAKFQGEVLHMQQENSKVADELQAGLDHVRGLESEIEKALSKLHQNSKLSGSKSSQYQNFKHSPTRTRIPLRSFLFGNKPKKSSLFSCINPALQKQYSDLRSAKFD
ncbi:protein NETWORKED 2A-like [Typha latifolia]|uniref:protein NETWORKED 2A-like n=1 Tax=Typha latifolia TaxID=4733 RepID=UPI003C2AF52F